MNENLYRNLYCAFFGLNSHKIFQKKDARCASKKYTVSYLASDEKKKRLFLIYGANASITVNTQDGVISK